MNARSILFAVIAALFSSGASALSLWEISGAMMDIDGKDIRVASVNTAGDKHVYHSHDFDKGVFVVATVSGSGTDALPRTTALIRDYLRSRGVNVVDKPDGASYALKFEVQDLNIDDASTKAPGNAPGGQGLAAAGVDLAAKTTIVSAADKIGGAVHGFSAFAGASTFHYKGDLLALTSQGISDPTYDKLGQKSKDFSKETDGVTARTAVKKSDPNTTTADLLMLMTKVWADKYFVKD